MKMRFGVILSFLSSSNLFSQGIAFSTQQNTGTKVTASGEQKTSNVSASRKEFLKSIMVSTAVISTGASPAGAAERAVGAAEKSCREEGNCLEKFDIDGAVGWNWGGKDRCDAA